MATRYPSQADDDQAERDEQILQEYLRSRPQPQRPARRPQPAQGLGTGFIKRQHAAGALRWIARGLALVLLYGSLLGTARLVSGLSPESWWDIRLIPLVAVAVALAIQAPITIAEFAFRHRRRSAGYLVPLAVDIATTYLGYRSILVPWLLVPLTSGQSLEVQMGAAGIVLFANLIALGLAAVVAVYPELAIGAD